VLDTIAAMVSGSRLKPGDFAARYVDSPIASPPNYQLNLTGKFFRCLTGFCP